MKTRSVLTHWAVTEMGFPATEVGLKPGLGQSAASRAAQRGRKIVKEMGLALNRMGTPNFVGYPSFFPGSTRWISSYRLRPIYVRSEKSQANFSKFAITPYPFCNTDHRRPPSRLQNQKIQIPGMLQMAGSHFGIGSVSPEDVGPARSDNGAAGVLVECKAAEMVPGCNAVV